MTPSWIWLGIVVYFVVQIAIGYWASRFIQNEQDYLLAGRSLGITLLGFSLFANWFGAETVMGSVSAIATHGLSGSRADPFGYTFCLLGIALLIAKPMRQAAYVTLGDLYRARFGVRNEKIAVCLMIPSSLIWAAAQLLAFAQILSLLAHIHVSSTLLAATLVVIIYTFMGGLLGNVITEFLQSFILILGLLWLLWALHTHLDDGLWTAWSNLPQERFSWFSAEESWLHRINTWSIPILGSLVAQEALSRTLAARTPRIAQRGALLAAGIYLSVACIPFIIAMVGGYYLTLPLEHPDQFLPTLAQKLLSPAGFLVLIAALLSAILSTLDCALLAVSALTAHNLILPFFPHWKESQKVLLARMLVILSGATAYLIAQSAHLIYHLVLAASSFGTAGILVTTLVGLYRPQQADAAVCTWTLLTGLGITLAGYFWDWEATFLYSLFSCLLCYCCGMLMGYYRRLLR